MSYHARPEYIAPDEQRCGALVPGHPSWAYDWAKVDHQCPKTANQMRGTIPARRFRNPPRRNPLRLRTRLGLHCASRRLVRSVEDGLRSRTRWGPVNQQELTPLPDLFLSRTGRLYYRSRGKIQPAKARRYFYYGQSRSRLAIIWHLAFGAFAQGEVYTDSGEAPSELRVRVEGTFTGGPE